ncbi:MAG: integration host factor subunit beta [bacterium]|nr:integration host factor subunit beta [bacterium]
MQSTFIKKDIVDRTASKANIDVKESAKVVEAVFTVLREIMMNANPGVRIEIRDFGVFEVKQTAAKPKARNPKKPDQVIYIPPRRKTHFKPGKLLKSALKEATAAV